MNAFLALVVISLCGIANALYFPVTARRSQGGGNIRLQKLHIDENVDNARDIVVSRTTKGLSIAAHIAGSY